MALTFTLGAGLIIHEGEQATADMLWAILGCNVAWGIIDGAMYLMTCVFERSFNARLIDTVKKTSTDDDALALIDHHFSDRLHSLTSDIERTRLYQCILSTIRSAQIGRTRILREDFYGAIASFFLVSLSAFPAIVPFFIFDNRLTALRVSNGLLLALLFLAGHWWGRVTRTKPWLVGSILLLVGLGLVAIAIRLGG